MDIRVKRNLVDTGWVVFGFDGDYDHSRYVGDRSFLTRKPLDARIADAAREVKRALELDAFKSKEAERLTAVAQAAIL